MRTRRGTRPRVWIRTLVSLLTLPGAIAADPAPPGSAGSETLRLLETLTPLLTLAMDEATWSDPARRKATQRDLARLAEAGALLGRHAASRDMGFRSLSQSLTVDIGRTRDLYAEGDLEQSRVSMLEITGTCAACHARLPGAVRASAPSLPEALMAELSLHQRGQVWMAAHRFDKALEVWEAALGDEMQAPSRLDMEGYLLDYMTIGLRVSQDPARVRENLARFARRPDMPVYLGRHLARWNAALLAVEADPATPDLVAHARALAMAEGVPRPALVGREQTVYDIVASGLLLRFIEEGGAERDRLAEAYYLLGVVEARSVDSYWLPQAEHHLEAAIRLAPGSPAAADAYALLEEYVVVGFGGANEEALPRDAWERLQELDQLIRAQRAGTEEERPPEP